MYPAGQRYRNVCGFVSPFRNNEKLFVSFERATTRLLALIASLDITKQIRVVARAEEAW